MVEEASLEFRLRKIDEARNYHVEEVNHNDLMSEKYKKTCKYLSYIEHLCFNFCIYFIRLCSCWYYKFCRRIKNLCDHPGIKKYRSIIKKKRTRNMIKQCC